MTLRDLTDFQRARLIAAAKKSFVAERRFPSFKVTTEDFNRCFMLGIHATLAIIKDKPSKSRSKTSRREPKLCSPTPTGRGDTTTRTLGH